MKHSSHCITLLASVLLLACGQDYRDTAPRTATHAQPVRDYHPSCPGDGDEPVPGDPPLDFDGPNDYYVANGVLDFPGGGSFAGCYVVLNEAERAVCSAYEHLRDAISFDPTPDRPDAPVTPDARLNSVSASFYFLRDANWRIARGFYTSICNPSIRRSNATFHRYAAAILAETVQLAEIVATEGTGLTVGISDGLKSSYGSFGERAAHVWGRAGDTNGVRAAAFSWYQGRPWRTHAELLGDEPLDITLPLCMENGSDPAVKRGVDLLLRYGVPVYTALEHYYTATNFVWVPWDGGSTFLGNTPAACVVNAVNKSRHDSGMTVSNGYTDLSYGDVLAQHDVTDDTLRQAALLLFNGTRVRLYNLDIEDIDGASRQGVPPLVGACSYLRGMHNAGDDNQSLQAKAYTGTFTGFVNDPVNNIDGLVPLHAFAQNIINCLLNVPGECVEYAFNAIVTDDQALHQLEAASQTIEGIIGSRYVHYQRNWYSSSNTNTRVDITLHGLDPNELSAVKFYSLTRRSGEHYPGMNGELFRFLSCLTYGHVQGEACNTDDYQICEGQSDCTVSLPHFEQAGQLRLILPARLIVVVLGDKVIDTFAETRPYDRGFYRWHVRHYLDDKDIQSRLSKVLSREADDCSAPSYNALGLRNDMPVPLENELTSDSDNYEDSFSVPLRGWVKPLAFRRSLQEACGTMVG